MTDTPVLFSGWLPTPHQLERAPQLAVLLALDSTLELAVCAVQVAHPEIDDEHECPYWLARPERLAAEKLLVRIERLRAAIARYRSSLPDEPAELVPDNPCDDELFEYDAQDDEIPF